MPLQWLLITVQNKPYFSFLTGESTLSDPRNKKKCKIRQITSVPEVHEQIKDVFPVQGNQIA